MEHWCTQISNLDNDALLITQSTVALTKVMGGRHTIPACVFGPAVDYISMTAHECCAESK